MIPPSCDCLINSTSRREQSGGGKFEGTRRHYHHRWEVLATRCHNLAVARCGSSAWPPRDRQGRIGSRETIGPVARPSSSCTCNIFLNYGAGSYINLSAIIGCSGRFHQLKQLILDRVGSCACDGRHSQRPIFGWTRRLAELHSDDPFAFSMR